MKTDLYTKSILTIIAIALVCLVLQNTNVITPAHASTTPPPHSHRVNEPTSSTIDVNIVSVDGRSFYSDTYNAIPVYVKNK